MWPDGVPPQGYGIYKLQTEQIKNHAQAAKSLGTLPGVFFAENIFSLATFATVCKRKR
ncbi:hypothetical protein PAFU01_39080 [Pantoea ananatis]|nr:hypothetical protein PAFU01_37960 [Pantoea ananatis]BBL32460.1 hypothetical protein PAFU01_39080 [Pantoea ananatis]